MEVLQVPEGHLLLQTIRSHDQFNTTIYGLSDRYRGIEGGRRVVFLHSDDVAALGFAEADLVDIVSDWEDGSQRRVPAFRLVGTTCRAGAPRRTTPRPTRCCRWSTPPRGATSRFPRRSSCVSSARPATSPACAGQ